MGANSSQACPWPVVLASYLCGQVLTFGDHGSYVIKVRNSSSSSSRGREGAWQPSTDCYLPSQVAAPRWNESFRAHLNVTVVHEPYDTWRPLTTLMGLVITAVVIDALVRWTVKEAASKEEVAGRGGYWNYLGECERMMTAARHVWQG